MNPPHETSPQKALRTFAGDPGSATQLMRAWSCTVRLVVDDARVLRPAAADLAALLARVDGTASRFRSDSDLSRANTNAGRPVAVPRLLVDLVAAALDAGEQTGGAVDPTVGRALHALGYDRDIATIAADGPPVTILTPRRSWRDVRLDRDAGLLTVPLGTSLDLGATAKAYLADHAAHALARRYDTAVLVELGGDLAVAGNRPAGWCIEVAERGDTHGEKVLLRHGGIATSTTVIRRWRRGGRPVHHIVDPRTGRSAAGPWRTASVYAACALAANAASTAAIVLGEQALPWLQSRNLPARLVDQDGAVTTTATWPTTRSLAVAS
jgi:thiamine biosynthesis lipoprotein